MNDDLKTLPLFSDLSEEVLTKIAAVITEKTYSDKEVIFKEGDKGDIFYIIKAGEVLIVKTKILAILQSGDFFGEMSLIDQSLRSASAVASGQVILYALTRQDFEKLLQSDFKAAQVFIFYLLQTVVQRLRQTDRELNTVYETGKIIASLFDLKKTAMMVLAKIMEALDCAQYALLAVWNEFIQEFEVQAQLNYPPAAFDNISLTPNEPIASFMAQNKEHLIIKNLYQDDRFTLKTTLPFYGESLMASPLISQNKCLGFIILTNKNKTNAFSLDQLNMLSGVAAQFSQAVDNIAHLEEEKSRRRLQSSKEM